MGVPVEEMLETEAYALAPTTAPLVEVFHDLEESAMDAIGLTDASGALVAQLSVADVIRFADQIFDNDCGTVSFDERESVQQLFDRLGQRLHDPVCVRRGETFGDCIAKMIAASTHRVWMVDDKDGLVGVIRQQDVLNAIANYLGL
ncbi:hypothetical protein SARC_08446 [Sphaeroforma arctica JP610]|uniref:CBS domain-containing protein n=1 Tax=Sphaeroforma arctica JP610 TaxID=667725 RepID=A0A0L0FQS6_9EUKA|nr:hypothetical protein SARC_08446 [Sphaeroforma arctica JP610]KNC79147.1 hypothetical protein SARC_08446 [Sphaeroforma arctica JP610]|eukprot:XP_014153049.1 hypothetical protein SARC_08446 [Sphaeroforma arctica JP610]